MIQSITVTGVKYDVDDTTKQYVMQKIGSLDRFLPRHARRSASVEVFLKEVNRNQGKQFEAEILLSVPDKKITAKDTTINMLAAVDIVEAKLSTQLRKYKEMHVAHAGKSRRILSKFKRSYAREQ